ncbi:MAG TPA: serpin family protein [Pirellulales bacterium]|nr:serpin family protein [Pirellulales bacterium]
MEDRWVLSASGLVAPAALTASVNSGTQAADETAAGNSIDAFALDLYAQLQSTMGGNLFVSPFSVATALTMAYAGAGGETAQQMASVLHLGSDASSIEADYGELLADLNAAGQSGGYLLSVANALWAQQGLDILPEFLNVIQQDFSGALQQVDYKDAAEAARETINDWVSQETHGKIQDVLPPGSLDDTTRLVLANAIYLKAAWVSPFTPGQTSDAPFTLASGSQVTAPTMHQTTNFKYMESDGFQVLELPYANGRLAMDILLPTQSGLSGLDSYQIPQDINGWLSGLTSQDVAVSLPKFQMTTQFELSAPLKALGMTDAFTRGADFSGITDPSVLHIDDVYHQAFISVDEAGTEAAAATVMKLSISAIAFDPRTPIQFNADHPFLFLIRDTQSGSVLFMGQVEDPTQQDGGSGPTITHEPGGQNQTTPSPVLQDPVLNPVLIPELPAPGTPTSPTPVTFIPPGSIPLLLGPAASKPVAQTPSVASPLDTSSEPAPQSTTTLSPNQKLVDAYYEALLDRAAEPAALAYWSNMLDGGTAATSVVSGIEATAEYRQTEVESLYEHYLARPADATGLAHFAGQLAAGGTIEQVAAALAGSPEFVRDHAGSSNLIDALFTTIVGRSVDAASLAFFQQELAAGATASRLAAQLLNSNEYEHQLAAALITRFLDRPADPAGTDHFASELRAGVTDEEVTAQILGSDEFSHRAIGS